MTSLRENKTLFGEVDGWIEELRNCKQLSESQMKSLCQKVSDNIANKIGKEGSLAYELLSCMALLRDFFLAMSGLSAH